MTREEIEKKAVERFPDVQNMTRPIAARERKAYIEGALMVVESQWVSVDERLPEHGQEVLTITSDGWYRINQFGSMAKGKFPSQVTHWQPLPEPPKPTK